MHPSPHPIELRAPAGSLPIGTAWREVADRARIVFPFDGSLVAEAPQSTTADSADALDAAEAARAEVAALTTAQRKAILTDIGLAQ